MNVTKILYLCIALSDAAGVQAIESHEFVTQQDNTRVSSYQTNRPEASKRLFVSREAERQIDHIRQLPTNAKLAWMFENCSPNTLNTTAHFDGKEDTFVYTGGIHAMRLHDSGVQVWPYVQLTNGDPKLKKILAGVIDRQLKRINIDLYANAFNMNSKGDEWMSDPMDMKPELHERRWEIDSFCYPIRLAYHHWKITGDASVFSGEWLQAIANVLKAFKEQQRKDDAKGPCEFQRKIERALNTITDDGWGNPVKPVGPIASASRPSDDIMTFQFLVPSNFSTVTSLRKATEALNTVNKKPALARGCTTPADEAEKALEKCIVCNHPKYDKVYAFEVDGFGNQLLMDDANVPSLIALSYLGDVKVASPTCQNIRKFVWSKDNPYFFKGSVGKDIGGPHIGYDMIWSMSIIMEVLTSQNDVKIKTCIKILMDTDVGTDSTHESFNKNDPKSSAYA